MEKIMKVIVNNHLYKMNKEEVKGLLEIARENIKDGIIAIEKDGLIEMRKDTFESNSKLKNMIKEYKDLGYKVYRS